VGKNETPILADAVVKNLPLGFLAHSRKPPFTEYSYIIDGTIAGEEVVRYTKSGISEKMMNKMKRGHIDNVSELDLHGYTIKL
jgi:DNA-nicking Smr family endonuclease